MHDQISAEGFDTRRARSAAITSNSARPRSQSPRCSRASTEHQLSQENHLHTSQSVAEEHEHGLFRPTLDINTFDKEKGQQQEVEAVEAGDEDYSEKDGEPQQEMKGVAAALTAKRVGDIHLSGKEDSSRGQPSNIGSYPEGSILFAGAICTITPGYRDVI